jgi:hypothetical protein
MLRSLQPYRLWIVCGVLVVLIVGSLGGRAAPRAAAQTADPPQILLDNRTSTVATVPSAASAACSREPATST